jgi:hypothetical protein
MVQNICLVPIGIELPLQATGKIKGRLLATLGFPDLEGQLVDTFLDLVGMLLKVLVITRGPSLGLRFRLCRNLNLDFSFFVTIIF